MTHPHYLDYNQVAAGIGPIVRLWLQPPRGSMQRTAMELREALVSRLAQSTTLVLTDAEKARVTRREVRAASFIDAAFGARICPVASPSLPPSTPPPSVPPSTPSTGPPPLQLLPPPLPPLPSATACVRVQLFDSFGDGWDGLQLVVSQLSGAAVEHSFTLSSGLSSTTASLNLPLGCHQLQMMYQGGEPLTSTSTSDVAEASWRLLDCPVGASSLVHLAHGVARACVTMDDAAEARCALLEAPMLPPPSPPSPYSPPREHLLSPSLQPHLPLPSPTPGIPPSPPPPPSLPVPSVFEATLPSPPLTPATPLSPAPQAPPPIPVPEPSPPLSPTMPLSPGPQTPPFPLVPYAAPVPPPPSLPLPTVYPPPLRLSPTPPPHLPPPQPARPPLPPAERLADSADMIGGIDADTFMMRLMFGVIGSAIAVFVCVTCYDVRRKDRRAQAYARSRAEHNAPINRSFVCGSSQTTAAQWLELGDRNAQPRRQSDAQLQQCRHQMGSPADAQQVPQQSVACIPSETALDGACSRSIPISPGGKSWFQQRFAVRSSGDSTGTSAQHAGATALPLFGWNRIRMSGPPSLSSVTAEASADDGTTEHQRIQVDANRFASPPLVVLATGDARVASVESLRQCFMLHSVVRAASAEVLENVLLEAAELRKLEPHSSLLRLCAVVTDQPCGEVGLLSELTTGSLASLLDTSPVRLTWANGLLALATDVAAGLAHLHGLGL